MAQHTTVTPSQETVEKAWHGWETFVRIGAVATAATALVVALVVALIAYA